MRNVSTVLAALFVLAFNPTLADVRDAGHCFCPQTTTGWMLYDDNSRRVPDAVRNHADVELREILVCDHGIHLFFNAVQGGQSYFVAFVIVRPVPELFRTRQSAYDHYYRWPGYSIETRSRHAMTAYNGYLGDLRDFLGGSYAEFRHILFRTERHTAPPRLHIGPPLRILWRGNTVELRGYVDVYFSGIS
jgi:hypothetical protein